MEAKSESAMKDIKTLVGSEVQGWKLTRVIGSGADGIVYAGIKEGVERAVKLFFPDSVEKNGIAAARERLELQLGLVGKKHHEHLVEFFDGGDAPELDTIFLVMELVPGTSLDKLLGSVPTYAVANLAGQLASVARFLEEDLELVHRDIKPANIIISDDFTSLTLLDLGIVLQQSEHDEQGRLSGMEFVATVRYSPPEFVWREEQEDIEGAWRAVTLYQVGATLHDIIMGVPLFTGHDTPRARLYDAVRYHTPAVESDKVDSWLIQTVQACLLKDWRQRLLLASWDSFSANPSSPDIRQNERRVRLLQVRKYERLQAEKMREQQAPSLTREQELWTLNANLIGEIRNYLLDTSIFPKCSIEEKWVSAREYSTHIHFEEDPIYGFPQHAAFIIDLAVDEMIEDATKLSFRSEVNEKSISSATWTEMFSVETAFEVCQRSLLGAVETLLED